MCNNTILGFCEDVVRNSMAKNSSSLIFIQSTNASYLYERCLLADGERRGYPITADSMQTDEIVL